jgi:hypothetical protein
LCIRNELCFGTRKKADIKKKFVSRIRDPGWRKIQDLGSGIKHPGSATML